MLFKDNNNQTSSTPSLFGGRDTVPLLREQPDAFRYEKEGNTKSGNLIVKGILQKSETLNQNKRVYPHRILEREVNNYQIMIKERRSFGELDHPESSVVELKNSSHIIVETWWENQYELWGKVEILNTPAGQTLKALFEADCTVGISSRGVGSTQHQNGVDLVSDDFMLICWDFVSEPSTPGAFMFKEHKEVSTALVENYFRSTGQLLYREASRIRENYDRLKGEH